MQRAKDNQDTLEEKKHKSGWFAVPDDKNYYKGLIIEVQITKVKI